MITSSATGVSPFINYRNAGGSPLYLFFPSTLIPWHSRFPFICVTVAVSALPSPLGFIGCKGLLSRLIRRLEVHFLQILPSRARVIWQEKPPYEALPTAVYRNRKTSKRFRQRKEPKGGK